MRPERRKETPQHKTEEGALPYQRRSGRAEATALKYTDVGQREFGGSSWPRLFDATILIFAVREQEVP